MIKISKLIESLNGFFPNNLALEEDNVGANFYFQNLEIDKIVVAMDMTIELANYLKNNNIKFVLLHHSVIFESYSEEIKNNLKKRIFKIIEDNQICCYVIHTNYDRSLIGMNNKILDSLNCQKIKLINNLDVSWQGELAKFSKIKTLNSKLKKILNLKYSQFVGNKNHPIKHISICSGAGNYTIPFIPKNCDLFITGELKWSSILELKQKNINTLILGHYMEEYFVQDLTKILKIKLPILSIIDYNKINIINLL